MIFLLDFTEHMLRACTSQNRTKSPTLNLLVLHHRFLRQNYPKEELIRTHRSNRPPPPPPLPSLLKKTLIHFEQLQFWTTVSCRLPTPHCARTALASQLCLGGIPKYRAWFEPHNTATSDRVPLKSSRETTRSLCFDIIDRQALKNPKKGEAQREYL